VTDLGIICPNCSTGRAASGVYCYPVSAVTRPSADL
jgi:hypothetical protein